LITVVSRDLSGRLWQGERALTRVVLEDLAGGRGRQHVEEHDAGGTLVGRKQRPNERGERCLV
jgi:hypothetical protein